MSLPVRVGVADPAGTPANITADPAAYPFTLAPVRITLSKDFAQEHPPGWPAPPSQTGVDAPHLHYPRTIASGTTVTMFACVAAALIAASAATAA